MIGVYQKCENLLYYYFADHLHQHTKINITKADITSESEQLKELLMKATSNYVIGLYENASTFYEEVLQMLGNDSRLIDRIYLKKEDVLLIKYLLLKCYVVDNKNFKKMKDFLHAFGEHTEQFPLFSLVFAQMYINEGNFIEAQEQVNNGHESLNNFDPNKTFSSWIAANLHFVETNPHMLSRMFDAINECLEKEQNTSKKSPQEVNDSLIVKLVEVKQFGENNELLKEIVIEQSEKNLQADFSSSLPNLSENLDSIDMNLSRDIENEISEFDIGIEKISNENCTSVFRTNGHQLTDVHFYNRQRKDPLDQYNKSSQTDKVNTVNAHMQTELSQFVEYVNGENNYVFKCLLQNRNALGMKVKDLTEKLRNQQILIEQQQQTTPKQNFANNEILLRTKLEDLQSAFKKVEERNKVEMQKNKLIYSIMAAQFNRYFVMIKNCISNHTHRCTRMITELSSISLYLTSYTIPKIEECHMHINIWNSELQRTKNCFNLLEGYHKKVNFYLNTGNLRQLAKLPELHIQLYEPKNLWHDNLLPMMALLQRQFTQQSMWPSQQFKDPGEPMHEKLNATITRLAEQLFGNDNAPNSNFSTTKDDVSQNKSFSTQKSCPCDILKEPSPPSTFDSAKFESDIITQCDQLPQEKHESNLLKVFQFGSSDFNFLNNNNSKQVKNPLVTGTEDIDNNYSVLNTHKNEPALNKLPDDAFRNNNSISTCTIKEETSLEVAHIKENDSVLSSAVKAIVGNRFCNLYLHVKSELPEVDANEILSALLVVRKKYVKLTGMHRGSIVKAVQEQLNNTRTKKKNKYSQEHLQNQCIICLRPYQSPADSTQFDCQHTFHINCMMKWYGYDSKCPMCKTHEKPSY